MEIEVNESLDFSYTKEPSGNMTLIVRCADTGLIKFNISPDEVGELSKVAYKIIQLYNEPVDKGMVGDLY